MQNLSDEPSGSAQPKPSQEDLAKMGDDLQDVTIEEVDDVDGEAPTEFEAEHASEPDVSTWARGFGGEY